MGKALAVLGAGLALGLAALLLRLDRSATRGGTAQAANERPLATAAAPDEAAARSGDLREPAPMPTGPAALPARHALSPAVAAHAEAEPEAANAGRREEDDGMLRAWYSNGQLEYESGRTLAPNQVWLREGPWRAWHANGQLHEQGAYHLGEETGYWEWWYENGNRMAVGQFAAGEREGFWRYWHEDGALMTECSYRAGKAHGEWTQFHPNGFKSAQGRFADGELVGEWTVWREDGTLNLDGTGVYASGKKVGE
jgi:hypothetical protein